MSWRIPDDYTPYGSPHTVGWDDDYEPDDEPPDFDEEPFED